MNQWSNTKPEVEMTKRIGSNFVQTFSSIYFNDARKVFEHMIGD